MDVRGRCRVRVIFGIASAPTRTSLCGPDMNASFAHQSHTLHTPHTATRRSIDTLIAVACCAVCLFYLEALERCLGPLCLVRHHAADDSPEDA